VGSRGTGLPSASLPSQASSRRPVSISLSIKHAILRPSTEWNRGSLLRRRLAVAARFNDDGGMIAAGARCESGGGRLLPDGRNRLILGDCLGVATSLPPGSLSFIYLDPPFGTGRRQPFRLGLGRSEPPMQDGADPARWWETWGERLRRIALLLRPGGVLVVHLDSRLAPRVRLGLEGILGAKSFLNEIVWHYRSGGVARDRFPSKHDTLLVHRVGEGHTFHPLKEKRYLAHRAARPGVEEHRDERGWYRFARVDDVWEIPILSAEARERTGYPTQKPEALVTRLLQAFTDPGDLVGDFTCGSGTLPAVAQRLDRAWIGCDIDPRAVVGTCGRLARVLSAELCARWNGAGVASRRTDLERRLMRWRKKPECWGLSAEEVTALSSPDLRGRGFRIERSVEAHKENARTPFGRKR
jgi:DNA modification methylase